MKTFISNFGRKNHLWSRCKDLSIILTLDDADISPLWQSGDRDGYIAYALAHKKTAAGITPTKTLASRWFNLGTIVSETSGDLWIHREKDELWWTISKPDPIQISLEKSADDRQRMEDVCVYQKPAQPWSCLDKKGSRLVWNAIHPKAREFLFTESTFAELSHDNAEYAQALIDGADLSLWEEQPTWKDKFKSTGGGKVNVFTAIQRSAWRMVDTAIKTASQSNGQSVERTVKNKENLFSNDEDFREYVEELIKNQDGLCAISGVHLHMDGHTNIDEELLCSLDRIDSDKHYEPGNLQVVCRFINRWKSDSKDSDFRRLIQLLQSS